MDKLEKKTLNVSRGFTYTYYTSPAKGDRQTLFLIHGFPSTSEEWAGVANDYLIPEGYGIIAVDCLGYAGTSRPLDVEAYSLKAMAQDFTEILDDESIDKAISLGHDWSEFITFYQGSPVAQRFHNFYPDRISGLALLSFPYTPPAPGPFDLDAFLELTTQAFGHGIYWYWKLFAAPDGPEVVQSHLESFWTLLHGDPQTWRHTLCERDGTREYLEHDKRQPVQAYATEEMHRKWLEQWTRDGIAAPINYYRAQTFGVQDKVLKDIPLENYLVKVPFFYFGGSRDYVCLPAMLKWSTDAGLLPNCTEVVVDEGHWAHLCQPKVFGEALLSWLKDNFGPATKELDETTTSKA